MPHLYALYKRVDGDFSLEIKMRHFVAHEYYGGFDEGHRHYVLVLARRASQSGVALDEHARRVVRQARAELRAERLEAERLEAEALRRREQEERLAELELDREAFDAGYAVGSGGGYWPPDMGTTWTARHRAVFGYAAALARSKRLGEDALYQRAILKRLITHLAFPCARHRDAFCKETPSGGLTVAVRWQW